MRRLVFGLLCLYLLFLSPAWSEFDDPLPNEVLPVREDYDDNLSINDFFG